MKKTSLAIAEWSEKRTSDAAYAPTLAATPSGTMLVGNEPSLDQSVEPASPSAETRTALPEPSGAPTRALAEAETRAIAAPSPPLETALPPRIETPTTSPMERPAPEKRGPRAVVIGSLAAALAIACAGAWALAASGSGKEAPPVQPAAVATPPPVEPPAVDPGRTRPAPQPRRHDEVPAVTDEARATGAERGATAAPIEAQGAPHPGEAREAPDDRRGQATLEIVVIPFGDVWIDGRRVGSAPIVQEVPPGPHVVATGDDGPTNRRNVRVHAGERRRVVIR